MEYGLEPDGFIVNFLIGVVLVNRLSYVLVG
jgi:hypothetical protein